MTPGEIEAASPRITLRPASANDSEFLMHVYASTRWDEMISWGWSPAQQVSFVGTQYDARQRGYAAAYPSAESSVVSVGDCPAGSLIVFRGQDELRLVDISLLPEFRSRGIGGHLIRMLISEAAGLGFPLRLSVMRGNRAARLYERLNFVSSGGDAMYCEMECVPARNSRNIAATRARNDSNAGKPE